MKNYIIVGCGLFGSTFARIMADNGRKCMVIDKRSHVAGNCYTQNKQGINVHMYGPHAFHTNNREIWEFVNRFASFNNYQHKVKVKHGDKIYSFPINLFTLHQLWGVLTPKEAQEKLNSVKIKIDSPQNLEEWALTQVGEEVYEKFIEGYTTKQWGCNPNKLPASIIRRIPIRLNFDDRYHDDIYQGVPIGGYTKMVENMLDHPNIEIRLNQEYEKSFSAEKIIYTGSIDSYFKYQYGKLEYRSLKFEHEEINEKEFQGISQINYTSKNIPYTRIIEHKYFEYVNSPKTIITKEYPSSEGIPLYPIQTEENNKKLEKYKKIASKETNVIFGGRLGEYRYYDMHQVIAAAQKTAQKEMFTVNHLPNL